jgi:hypothetical protein
MSTYIFCLHRVKVLTKKVSRSYTNTSSVFEIRSRTSVPGAGGLTDRAGGLIVDDQWRVV